MVTRSFVTWIWEMAFLNIKQFFFPLPFPQAFSDSMEQTCKLVVSTMSSTVQVNQRIEVIFIIKNKGTRVEVASTYASTSGYWTAWLLQMRSLPRPHRHPQRKWGLFQSRRKKKPWYVYLVDMQDKLICITLGTNFYWYRLQVQAHFRIQLVKLMWHDQGYRAKFSRHLCKRLTKPNEENAPRRFQQRRYTPRHPPRTHSLAGGLPSPFQ